MSTPTTPAPGSADPAPARSLHDRLSAWTTAQIATPPRFVSERPPSLREHVAYARRGDWHAQPDGPARRWHLAFTYGVTAPVCSVAAVASWAAARPGRFFPLLALAVLLATALNTVPALAWFVPDWASATHWPPLSWPAGEE